MMNNNAKLAEGTVNNGGVLCQMIWQLLQESSQNTMLSGTTSNSLEMR
jgi:hypothetical protein